MRVAMSIPDGYQPKGPTAIVRMDTGDIIAKTNNGVQWHYEVHIRDGASWFGVKDLDVALAIINRERGN